MDLLDDYRDEMDALSSEQVEAVLSGRVPQEPVAARAATLVDDLRQALREDPAPEVARTHLTAMLAAAEESGLTRSRRSIMPVLTRRRLGGLALAATLVLGGGLAAALTPPELPEQAAEEAHEAVGQGPDVAEEASAHGKAVSELAQDPTLEGCEKGQAVAALASSKADDHRQDDANRTDPCAQADDTEGAQNGDGRGEDASALGQAVAEEARADGKAYGQKTASEAQQGQGDFGKQTAQEASGGTQGGEAAEKGLTIPGDASGGASDSGGSPPGGPPGN
jgi:hypothetical protein